MTCISIGVALGSQGLAEEEAFVVAFTGLDTDSLGSYAEVGNHAVIGYTIDPDNGTDTVAWGTANDDDTYGTGASPTDFTAGDGGFLVLSVTDGANTYYRSAAIRKAPATGGADLDLSFVEDSAITSTDLVQNWTTNGNTLTYVSVSPTLPTGLSINSSGMMTGTPTTVTADDTYTLTMEDEYGRETSDTFTLEITSAATGAFSSAFSSAFDVAA